MEAIEIFKIFLIGTIAICCFALVILAIKKLMRSKIDPNLKIIWIISIFIFHFMGIIVFLIFHDLYLQPELRGDF